MNLLVLGPQGAGKGTQAKRIASEYGIPHVSTGDMFRAAQAEGTEFGKQVGEIMAYGRLVPDELTIAMIEERLSQPDAQGGFVLDGFPRNLAQAEALDLMLGGIGRGLDAILFFEVTDEVGMRRALERAQVEGRADDTPELIAKRLADLPLGDRTDRRALPRHRQARARARRPVDRRGVVGDLRFAAGGRVIIRKSAQEIETMARAGKVVAETLALIEEQLQPGSTTAELDDLADEFIRSHGGVPTFKGYKGYPAATCLSPNSMVVHGIPGPLKLQDGDILSVDVGVTLDGFVADSAWTYAVGSISAEAQRLLDTCQAALEAGIREARLGNSIGDISQAVQAVTEDAGYSVIRSLVGHGVGRSMHEDPQVPNFVSTYRGPELKEGMTIAIEPMITAGGPDVYIHDDDWSISTTDGSLAAHFEHTVAVTAAGPRILTGGGVLVP